MDHSRLQPGVVYCSIIAPIARLYCSIQVRVAHLLGVLQYRTCCIAHAELMMNISSIADMPDQKVAIITGASSGMSLETGLGGDVLYE